MKKTLFFLFNICSIAVIGQNSHGNNINASILHNEDTTKLKYVLSISKPTKIRKSPIISFTCDFWFSDIVLKVEKFDSSKNEFVKLDCKADGSPPIYADGTIGGPIIEVKDTLIVGFASICVKRTEENKYRKKRLPKGTIEYK